MSADNVFRPYTSRTTQPRTARRVIRWLVRLFGQAQAFDAFVCCATEERSIEVRIGFSSVSVCWIDCECRQCCRCSPPTSTPSDHRRVLLCDKNDLSRDANLLLVFFAVFCLLVPGLLLVFCWYVMFVVLLYYNSVPSFLFYLVACFSLGSS